MEKSIKNSLTKKITTIALFTALSLVVFAIENAFPPLFLPGAKMGLANIFSLIALIMFGFREALFVVITRTLLGGFLVGNPMSMVFSFSAGIVSLCVAWLLYYFIFPKISIICISIASAVVHNLVQNLIFCLISGTPKLFSYMPYLALIGFISGAIVGLVALYIVKKIPKIKT